MTPFTLFLYIVAAGLAIGLDLVLFLWLIGAVKKWGDK